MSLQLPQSKILLVLVTLFSGAFLLLLLWLKQPFSPKIQTVSKQEIKNLLAQEKTNNSPILIDLRTDWEIKKTGKIPGAIHINYFSFNFSEKLKALDPNKSYIVYCWVGVRSNKAAQKMHSMGLDVIDYHGGMKDWLK
ncbi:MAG TPA: rhodanese-like domain-containing protein [Oligoflexia bacterium]|nr:rhodanese-like domain-containing protein [Oligoflexia bacterium]HMR25333.1 rhodanese-like domain-containing protein [Oligoflexia bacterium]